MHLAPIIKIVRGYDSTEWEIFISEWQKGLRGYVAVKRLGGAGDHGRDVIGLCGPQACQGIWDNYQCKHYETPLSAPKACEDAGKIIFHAFRKQFTPPRKCVFVAPRGPTTELRDMLLNPDKFRKEVLETWHVRIAGRVVAGQTHKLEGELAIYAQNYDYTSSATRPWMRFWMITARRPIGRHALVGIFRRRRLAGRRRRSRPERRSMSPNC